MLEILCRKYFGKGERRTLTDRYSTKEHSQRVTRNNARQQKDKEGQKGIYVFFLGSSLLAQAATCKWDWTKARRWAASDDIVICEYEC